MGSADQPPPLVEPVVVHTVFVSGVIPEDMGDGTVMFTAYVTQRHTVDNALERIVVARYIMPKKALIDAMHRTAREIFDWALSGEIPASTLIVPPRQH